VIEDKAQPEPGGTSWINFKEISAVAAEVGRLVSSGIMAEDIGVISPYSGQNERLEETLRSQDMWEVEVGSPELYQGREKQIVLYSAVRHDERNEKYVRLDGLGHTADPRRICVAISRARDQMIVFGSPFTMSNDPHWSKVIRKCLQLGTVEHDRKDSSFCDKLSARIQDVWGF
jgi:helicase MOV-10